IDDNPVRQPGQGALQDARGLVGIQMLDRLIEKNDWTTAEKRAGKIQPVRFAERQHVLTDPGTEPARSLNTTVELHGGKRQPAFFSGHVRCEKVLTNGIGKNGRIMQTKM